MEVNRKGEIEILKVNLGVFPVDERWDREF